MIEILKNTEWHHAFLVFAIFFVLVFRKPIAGLIQRTNSISTPWITATVSPESQRTADTKETTRKAAKNLIKKIGNSVILQSAEEDIKKTLEEERLETHGDTIEILVKDLAATNILLRFEKIYGIIFGSQIALLKMMNQNRGAGITKQDIQPYFNIALAAAYQGLITDVHSEQYVEFLLVRNLISCSEEKYYIEEFGVEYLMWMARNGKLENKRF